MLPFHLVVSPGGFVETFGQFAHLCHLRRTTDSILFGRKVLGVGRGSEPSIHVGFVVQNHALANCQREF